MFPNVGFDAGLTSTVTAFKSANHWITETIRFIAGTRSTTCSSRCIRPSAAGTPRIP